MKHDLHSVTHHACGAGIHEDGPVAAVAPIRTDSEHRAVCRHGYGYTKGVPWHSVCQDELMQHPAIAVDACRSKDGTRAHCDCSISTGGTEHKRRSVSAQSEAVAK